MGPSNVLKVTAWTDITQGAENKQKEQVTSNRNDVVLKKSRTERSEINYQAEKTKGHKNGE